VRGASVALDDGREAVVRDGGTESVVLMFFRRAGAEKPDAAWGFESYDEFKRFLKMLLRFDEAISNPLIRQVIADRHNFAECWCGVDHSKQKLTPVPGQPGVRKDERGRLFYSPTWINEVNSKDRSTRIDP
jgi:hypothetical protein